MEVVRNVLITVARLLTVMERQAGNQVPAAVLVLMVVAEVVLMVVAVVVVIGIMVDNGGWW